MEATGNTFSELVPDPRLLPPGHMLSGLACCHTVALLGGQPLGDPLELKMIESTGWVRVLSALLFRITFKMLSFRNVLRSIQTYITTAYY